MKNNILLLLTVFTFMSCSDSDNELLEKLQAAVEKEPGKAGYTVVQLERLTDFEWDTVYYFGGEVDLKQIEYETGIKWDGKATPSGHDRLLFVNNNQVVGYVDYELEEFPLRVFGCNSDRWIYPRSRSTFAAFKYCQNDKEEYAFIPEPCVSNIRELIAARCKTKSDNQ